MRRLDLSGKIDEYTLALYEHIISAASALEIQFFVIGATARDLILDRNYNIRPFRATEDVDLFEGTSYIFPVKRNDNFLYFF